MRRESRQLKTALVGRRDAPVMLNMDQVGELVEHLQAWLESGKLTP